MANHQRNLQRATNKLAKYYGLTTARDLAGQIAISQIQNINNTETYTLDPLNDTVSLAISSIIDTSEGAFLTKDVATLFNNAIKGEPQSTEGRTNLSNFLEIHGAGEEHFLIDAALTPITNSLVNSLNIGDNINKVPAAPTKEIPNLVLYKMNHIRANPASKNINSSVIFLNGVPNLELAKAVPVIDIQLIFPGPPVSDAGALQNISLFRFLEGNQNVLHSNSNSFRIAYAYGTQQTVATGSSGTANEDPRFTVTGMDVFLSPQTLVNADESNAENVRINPILDKFQPLMTIKSLDIQIAPSTGLMSFKTGKLSLTLHDRSRLAEISDLIRPDLYARTELMIEYGWSHPEASNTSIITNDYAELINAMRCKEKYGIVNTSLSISESGQVEITLELAMKGGISANTEFISNDEDGSISRIIDTIRELEQTIGMYRQRVFGQSPGGATREIRGIQILDAAEDARNHILLNKETRDNLKSFRNQLGNNGNPNGAAAQLLSGLQTLFGSATAGNNRENQNSQVGQLRRSVQAQIRAKLIRLSEGTDSFLREPPAINTGSGNQRNQKTFQEATRESQNEQTTGGRNQSVARDSGLDLTLPDNISPVVSLGKIISLFVGVPLAHTNRYDEIQLIFYPFNQYAGFANSINIASFAVNTRYFYEQYSRHRLENTSRAANITIRDFFNFLSSTILDDIAAPAYGLFQAGLAKYERNDAGLLVSSTRGEPALVQTKLEQLLLSRTPDGSFRMPQVDFYIETLPQKIQDQSGEDESGDGKTILRLHVFDRQNSCYETQNSLIAAARDDEIRTISQIPSRRDGDTGVVSSQEAEASSIINAAVFAGLIERNQNSSTIENAQQGEVATTSTVYRIAGGTKKLKEFIMRTTPYIIYGAQGTTVTRASVTSIQDSQLSTVNMLRSFQSTNMEANGELPGGLPLQIIPTEVSVACLGNPLIDFAQQFFIDFQTGTSIDNLYAVTGISHQITNGEFSTDLKMAPLDAWGKYRSLIERANSAAQELDRINDNAGRQSIGT